MFNDPITLTQIGEFTKTMKDLDAQVDNQDVKIAAMIVLMRNTLSSIGFKKGIEIYDAAIRKRNQ